MYDLFLWNLMYSLFFGGLLISSLDNYAISTQSLSCFSLEVICLLLKYIFPLVRRESYDHHSLQSMPANKQWKKWMKILPAVNVHSGDVPAGDLHLSINLAHLLSKSQCWTTVCEEIHCTDMNGFRLHWICFNSHPLLSTLYLRPQTWHSCDVLWTWNKIKNISER